MNDPTPLARSACVVVNTTAHDITDKKHWTAKFHLTSAVTLRSRARVSAVVSAPEASDSAALATLSPSRTRASA